MDCDAMNRKQTVATLPRFIYLNGYAFLLLFMGACAVAVPLFSVCKWFVIPQVILFAVCWKGAFTIFRSWGDKQRKYSLLMQRNAAGLRPDTFTEFMQAPCGRLLVKVVLEDLDMQDRYSELQYLRQSFWHNLKSGCKSKKTVIYYPEERL